MVISYCYLERNNEKVLKFFHNFLSFHKYIVVGIIEHNIQFFIEISLEPKKPQKSKTTNVKVLPNESELLMITRQSCIFSLIFASWFYSS